MTYTPDPALIAALQAELRACKEPPIGGWQALDAIVATATLCARCDGCGQFGADCIACNGSGHGSHPDAPCVSCSGHGGPPCDACCGTGRIEVIDLGGAS